LKSWRVAIATTMRITESRAMKKMLRVGTNKTYGGAYKVVKENGM
jgi:hypothetical protein